MADERDTENPDEMYHPHVHEEGTLLKWDDDSDHDVNETGHYELMAEAIRELLIEKGVVTADEIRENLEFMDSRGTHLGAKVVAKAWTDPAFKNRLMEDGSAAVGELGIPMGDVELVVVARATRAPSSGCRRIGTNRRTIARGWSMSRARCCVNSAPTWPTT